MAGLFATKPYIGGSNYILKNGRLQTRPWARSGMASYWRFIDPPPPPFFRAKPPAFSMMREPADKMIQSAELGLSRCS